MTANTCVVEGVSLESMHGPHAATSPQAEGTSLVSKAEQSCVFTTAKAGDEAEGKANFMIKAAVPG